MDEAVQKITPSLHPLLCRCARQHSPLGFKRCLEDPKHKGVEHWVVLPLLQMALSFSDPIQRCDGDGRGRREVKEPFCSPQNKAGLRCNTQVVQDTVQKEMPQLEMVQGVGERCYRDSAWHYCRHLGRGYPTSQARGGRGEKAVVLQRS